MKAATVFAAVAAVVFATTSLGLSVQAQSNPQTAPAPPPAAAAAPSPAKPATPAAPAAAAPAADASKAGELNLNLTKEETDAAEAVLTTKCTICHGVENIIATHYNREEWQHVLDDMGVSAELTKTESALALRYLVKNQGPAPKP